VYDIADIITLIEVTGYIVEPVKAKEPVLTELGKLPIIYVGYRGLDSKNPTTPESFSNYEQYAENLVQTIDVQICCLTQDLPTIWRSVYASLSGKSTQPPEEQYSSITYQKGGVIGIENDRLWWLDRWGVQFPSMNPFTFPHYP